MDSSLGDVPRGLITPSFPGAGARCSPPAAAIAVASIAGVAVVVAVGSLVVVEASKDGVAVDAKPP